MTRKTNVEIVTHIMDFSKAGPMAQMLIVEAIKSYCDNTLENKVHVIEAMKNGFVSGEAWVNTAKIVLEEMNTAYEGNR